MRIRVKKRNMFGIVKVESFVKIDNVSIKENIIEPEKASVDIFFKGKDSSGIITLGMEEAESLAGSLRSGLVRKMSPEKVKSDTDKVRKRTWHKKTVVSSS